MRLWCLAPLLALGACATPDPARGPEARLVRALDGRVAGAPVKCVPASFVDGPEIIDGRTLIYRQGAGRVWRNDLPESCPFLKQDRIIVVELFGSEMCRNDLFSVVDRIGTAIPIGKCRLGDFTPYDRAKE